MSETKFRTEVQIPDYSWKISYKSSVVFMGSCFTENVGQKMADLKYQVDINPFGILYNPVSVANGIRLLLQTKTFQQDDLIEHQGVWHSFFHHGRFSSVDATETLKEINDRLQFSSGFLKNADFLLITFGTAWVYRYQKSGEIVSNCHKIPAKEFVRDKLTVSEIVEIYRMLLDELWKVNPDLKIVFTLSPIRHWKDGAIENQRSKSTLLLAIEELVQLYEQNCSYFPSYEIVMDELRDYRFYAADMLHLNDVAVDFIWTRFQESMIEAESRKTSLAVRKIMDAFQHRPIRKNSPEFKKFIENSLKQTLKLEKEFPYLNLKLEKEYFIRHLDVLTD